MIVYKIRNKSTGLFKTKRPSSAHPLAKWDEAGDIYKTIGIARGAAKAALRNDEDLRLEIVEFLLQETNIVTVTTS